MAADLDLHRVPRLTDVDRPARDTGPANPDQSTVPNVPAEYS
jgi:hypothetical protein